MAVAAVPHSGNDCSGLCQPPCGHTGCWQCDLVDANLSEQRRVTQQDRDAAKKLNGQLANGQLARAMRDAGPLSRTEFDKTVQALVAEKLENSLRQQIVGSGPGASPRWVPPPAPPAAETATITREALEGLVSQIPGVVVEWNGGSPIFRRTQDGKAVQPADYFPKAAMKRSQAKSSGASDADIEAAEKVLRSMPMSDVASDVASEADIARGWKASLMATYAGMPFIAPASVMGVSMETFLDHIDAEMAVISGLKDLVK